MSDMGLAFLIVFGVAALIGMVTFALCGDKPDEDLIHPTVTEDEWRKSVGRGETKEGE